MSILLEHVGAAEQEWIDNNKNDTINDMDLNDSEIRRQIEVMKQASPSRPNQSKTNENDTTYEDILSRIDNLKQSNQLGIISLDSAIELLETPEIDQTLEDTLLAKLELRINCLENEEALDGLIKNQIRNNNNNKKKNTF